MWTEEHMIIETIEDDDGFELRALWRDRPCGRLLCSIEGGQFILADVHVESTMVIPWPVANRLLMWMGFRRRARSFRQQGIGSKLLDRFLAEAQSRGGTEVIGFISERDLRASPYLPAWYACRGFVVRDGGWHPGLGNAAKTIILTLCSEGHAPVPTSK